MDGVNNSATGGKLNIKADVATGNQFGHQQSDIDNESADQSSNINKYESKL